jgi:inorganic triphosphatase YgiF
MPVEVELKYLASDPGVLRRLALEPRLGPAALGTPRTVTEVDTYLDTADGRLGAARWACRLRERNGAVSISLKGPPEPGAGGALHRRPEVEGPAGDGRDPVRWPASEARDLLDGLRAGAPLIDRLRLCQARTERGVVMANERIGTLTLDVVEVESGDHRAGTLHVVELELAADGSRGEARLGEARLGELAIALDAIGGLVADERTKLERAMAMLGIE